MKYILFCIALLFCGGMFAQQKALLFIEQGTHKPIIDADVYTDSVFVAATTYTGNVKVDISGNYNNIIVDHIAYEKRIIPRDSLVKKKVYQLKRRADVLDEVVVDRIEQQDTVAHLRGWFSWGQQVATYVKHRNNNYIKNLKFRVVNYEGVKGLNYLPFSANVYSYDTIAKLPGKQLLPHDIRVENPDGNKWAVADISAYKIQVPREGICILFIIPDKEYVQVTDFVWSKIGRISANPTLQHISANRERFSFALEYAMKGNEYVPVWRRIKWGCYNMALEVEE